MNINELRSLKAALEQYKKYAIIENYQVVTDFNSGSIPKVVTTSELDAEINTYEVIKEYEKIIEHLVRELTNKGASVDSIDFTSKLGLVINRSYFDNAKDKNFNWRTSLKLDDLQFDILPVEFKYYSSSGFVGFEYIDKHLCERMSISNDTTISGIIELNEFVKKITDLGYNISFMNSISNTKVSYLEYIEEIKKENLSLGINISVPINKQKSLN